MKFDCEMKIVALSLDDSGTTITGHYCLRINSRNVAANVVVLPFSDEIKLCKSQGAQGRG